MKASARRACPRTLTIARTPLNCWSPCLRRHKSTVAPSKSALRSEPASRAALRTLPAGAIVRSRKLQLFALPCRPGGRVARAFVVLARSVQHFAHMPACPVRMRAAHARPWPKPRGVCWVEKLGHPDPWGGQNLGATLLRQGAPPSFPVVALLYVRSSGVLFFVYFRGSTRKPVAGVIEKACHYGDGV